MISSISNNDDTIAAISTPLGEGGIGIVRISGKKAFEISDRIFLGSKKIKPSKAVSFTAHYGYIVDTKRNGREVGSGIKIDEVILTVMRAPHTYTREDVAEISCHGGVVVLKKILDLVISCGARLAAPGEFTQRAFLNGRIDLMQAEAVLNIVKAKSDAALAPAMYQLRGKLSGRINIMRERIIEIAAPLEAGIDFPDDGIDALGKKKIRTALRQIREEVEMLIAGAEKGIILQNGISMAIAGAANVGKSSIMNELLDYERVIVTHVSGTTRDVVEETVDMCGIPVRIADTAGLMDSECFITRKSIDRSMAFLDRSDLVLLVLDGSRKADKAALVLAERIRDKKVIIAVNKIDLKQKLDISKIRKILPKVPLIRVSALKKKGIGGIEQAVKKIFLQGGIPGAEEILVSNVRQKEALTEAGRYLKLASELAQSNGYDECLVFELKQALSALNVLVGEDINEEILNDIFSRFCVGK